MYRPTELIAFLKEIGAAPKKSLSQNFLIDGNIVDKIVLLADVKKGDTVIEIGPGPGVLTEALLTAGAHVVAIEKDRKFAAALSRLQTEDMRLKVYEADALDFSYPQIDCKVVANLPYQITTPLLTKLLPLHQTVRTLTLMVQKELAIRMMAKPGSKDYSSLSLFIGFYSHPKKGFLVSPSCFYPKPKVDSAVIQLVLKTPPLVSSEKAFFTMVRKAFCHRRKLLCSSLKTMYPMAAIEKGLEKARKSRQARPEEMSLDDFLTLFHELEKQIRHPTTE
jgi:16S rRNA (adenine1518-N6/adenine1519-N6)-dimethyltransferase